jgi:hypothetical protein
VAKRVFEVYKITCYHLDSKSSTEFFLSQLLPPKSQIGLPDIKKDQYRFPNDASDLIGSSSFGPWNLGILNPPGLAGTACGRWTWMMVDHQNPEAAG